MKKLKWMGAVVILALVATVVGTVVMTRAQGANPQAITVTITPNSDPTGPPSVSPDPVTVGNNQEVEWTCSTGCDFTVTFTETTRKPFRNRSFDKANPRSGVPTGPPGTYKYSVIVGEGVADPQVIVH